MGSRSDLVLHHHSLSEADPIHGRFLRRRSDRPSGPIKTSLATPSMTLVDLPLRSNTVTATDRAVSSTHRSARSLHRHSYLHRCGCSSHLGHAGPNFAVVNALQQLRTTLAAIQGSTRFLAYQMGLCRMVLHPNAI